MSPSIDVCRLERLKRPYAGALRLADCYIDRMVGYLVVTMHQAHLSLKLQLLPRSSFKCQALPYLKGSFKAIVPGKSIIRNQVSPLSICHIALPRFDPRAILAFTFVSVSKPSIPYRNHALQSM